MKLLDGKLVQNELMLELKEKLAMVDKKLKLVIIRVGDNDEVDVYVRQKIRKANELGIAIEVIKFDNNVIVDEVLEVIDKLNCDDMVDGIMIQLPFSNDLDSLKIRNSIDPLKDVDGLSFGNIGKLWQGGDCLVSCTALGIMELLDYYKIEMSGKSVVIVNRSDLVGKPLAGLFMGRDATVTVCHSKSCNLSEITKNADILVTAVGISNFITVDMVKDDAIVIDAGISYVDGRVVGDVDFDGVKDRVSYITPVPGGVGPMTVIELMNNLYKAYLMRREK